MGRAGKSIKVPLKVLILKILNGKGKSHTNYSEIGKEQKTSWYCTVQIWNLLHAFHFKK